MAFLRMVLIPLCMLGCSGQPNRPAQPAVTLTEEGIRQALSGVYDPELEINIVDLGLVRNITLSEQKDVRIGIIFTSLFCPYSGILIAEIKQAVSAIPGAGTVTVAVDGKTVWVPELMSEAARVKLESLFQ